ncbi:MAG: flagellar motor protein MotD [Rhodanobacter sp.]
MRKKRQEEHLNHEAWAIPYADLMTLLLAFFVVMYAVSVVNKGKYRVMSESMTDAFNGHPAAIVPVAGGKTGAIAPPSVPATNDASSSPIRLPIPLRGTPAAPATERAVEAGPAKPSTLARIEDQIQQALQPLIDRKLVILRRTPDRLEIEIRTDILFSSGAAQLSASASRVLVGVASILGPFPNALRVEGFTDNVPINTPIYPSNWELSAARAASVARLFAGHGVAPGRLGIVGWGQVRPIADNATNDGRNQNRRVLVVVEGDHAASEGSRSTLDQLGQTPVPNPVAAAADTHALPTVQVHAAVHSSTRGVGPLLTPPLIQATAAAASSAGASAPESTPLAPTVLSARDTSARSTIERRNP